MAKKVSIIVPTHKGSEYIESAVSSALNQDYDNIEVIVVDDNGIGTDEQIKTQKVIQKFITDKRFKYIAHVINKNGSAARNTGFRASSGDYITLLDDDDIYLKYKVRIELERLDALDESWGMAYCSGIIDNGKIKTIREAKKSGNLIYELLLHKIEINSNSMFLRKDIYEKLGGFDETFRRHQDYEFSVRVSAICKIVAIPEVGFIHKVQISRNSPKTVEIARERRMHYIDKMMPYIEKYDKCKQYIIVYSNMFDVIPSSDRKKKIISTYNQVCKDSSTWLPKKRLDIYLYVFFIKALKSLKKRVKNRYLNYKGEECEV